MTYALASDSWGEEEIEAIQKVIKSGRYTMGPFVKQYEKEFSYYLLLLAFLIKSKSSLTLFNISIQS